MVVTAVVAILVIVGGIVISIGHGDQKGSRGRVDVVGARAPQGWLCGLVGALRVAGDNDECYIEQEIHGKSSDSQIVAWLRGPVRGCAAFIYSATRPLRKIYSATRAVAAEPKSKLWLRPFF